MAVYFSEMAISNDFKSDSIISIPHKIVQILGDVTSNISTWYANPGYSQIGYTFIEKLQPFLWTLPSRWPSQATLGAAHAVAHEALRPRPGRQARKGTNRCLSKQKLE